MEVLKNAKEEKNIFINILLRWQRKFVLHILSVWPNLISKEQSGRLSKEFYLLPHFTF